MRPGVSPDQVHIYLQPPVGAYEEIAQLDATGVFAFTAQGRTDQIVNRLKAQAGKLGANGVLLQQIGYEWPGAVVGTGVAIYVEGTK